MFNVEYKQKNNGEKNVILSIRNLSVYFYTYAGIVRAVEGLNLDIFRGEVLGLVGETGCGKSITALAILRLIDPPGKIVEGDILFNGESLLTKTEEEMRKIRGKKIAIIFQDPTTYLNPVYTIGNQIEEAISHSMKSKSKNDIKRLVINALKLLKIPDPERTLRQYPNELSTGMRQRAMIAMMLSCNPELLIADEATTALDVTVQAQILDLLLELKDKLQLSLLIITHNFGVVSQICDRVAVLYAGNLVEIGSKHDILLRPLHPYTQALIKAIPSLEQDSVDKLVPIHGTLPDLIHPPPGCRFHLRCPYATLKCSLIKPRLLNIKNGRHVACHMYC